MHLPSRGLRLSATTMRKTGWFFAPMRFIRILTDIKCFAVALTGHALPAARCWRLFSKKRGEPRLELKPWQGGFWAFFWRWSAGVPTAVTRGLPVLGMFVHGLIDNCCGWGHPRSVGSTGW